MKHLLGTALAALGYRVQGTRYCPRQLLEPGCLRVIEFDDLVCRRMFESGPELTFIQVGAFDGITPIPCENTSTNVAGGAFWLSRRLGLLTSARDVVPARLYFARSGAEDMLAVVD